MDSALARCLALSATAIIGIGSPVAAPAFERYGERIFPKTVEEALESPRFQGEPFVPLSSMKEACPPTYPTGRSLLTAKVGFRRLRGL